MESQKRQAFIIALRLLAATPKSRQQLFDKLIAKGFPAEIIHETLSDLEAQGILNDKAYAQNLVAKFTHANPSGHRKISFELRRKGIPQKVREEILSAQDPEAERGRARQLCRLRLERLKNVPEAKRKKRVYDFLIRRGFDFQIVRDLLEEME